MKQNIYIEMSVARYLVSRSSKDIVIAGWKTNGNLLVQKVAHALLPVVLRFEPR